MGRNTTQLFQNVMVANAARPLANMVEAYGVDPDGDAAWNTWRFKQAIADGGYLTLKTPGIYEVTDDFAPTSPIHVAPGVTFQTAAGGPVTTLAGFVLPIAASMHANTLAIVGDSRTKQGYNTDGSYTYWNANGWWVWAGILSGQLMTPVFIAAQGNSRITSSGAAPGVWGVDQMDQCIASGADNIAIMIGINDALNAAPMADVRRYFDLMIERGVRAGRRIWLHLAPGFNSTHGSFSADNQQRMYEINRWLRQRVATTWAKRGCVVVDHEAVATDPTNTNGNALANHFSDGLHQCNVGAYREGKEVARVWAQHLPEVPRLVTSRADNYTKSTLSSRLFGNGLMLDNAAGLATQFTGTALGTGASTNSIISNPNGFGSMQRMAQTSAAANDGYRFAHATLHANGLVAGDIVQLACRVTVTAPVKLRGLTLQLVANGSVGRGSFAGYPNPASDVDLPEGFSGVFMTPPVQISGSPSSVYGRLDSGFTGAAGSATIDVGQWTFDKLTP